jgi:hypothetical protein
MQVGLRFQANWDHLLRTDTYIHEGGLPHKRHSMRIGGKNADS